MSNQYTTFYTKEQIERIKNEYSNEYLTIKDIAEKFTEKFNINMSAMTIKSIKYKHFRDIKKPPHYYRITPEIGEFIKEQLLEENSYIEIRNNIKQKFNCVISADAIADYSKKKLNIYKKTNKGQYKKGNIASRLYQIGDEVERNGYVRIKVGQPMERVQKQKYVYELNYGKLKDDEFIIFLDGNTKNCDINNLAKVNRKILVFLNSHKYANKCELTRTAIKYCELENLLKEK